MTVCTLFLVTGEAHLRLCLSFAHLVGWRMHLVAVVACHLVVIVLAAIPVGAIGALVTTQALAGTGLVIRYFISALLENNVRRGAPLDVGITLQVFLTFAVTGLAVRRAHIAPYAVLGLID